MLNSFQLIDIIIVIGICQGIFLSLTLQRISNNNRSTNMILSSLLLLATVMLIGRFVYFRFLNAWVFQWSLLADSVVFLFGPLFYIYIRRLLFKGNASYRLPLVHFIPFVGMIGIAVCYIVFYSPEAYYQLLVIGDLTLVFEVLTILMIAFNIIYLIKSFELLKRYKTNEKDTFSFNRTPLTYLYFFSIAFTICLIAWLFSFINATFLDKYLTFVNYESIWVVIPIFIYVIGYFSLKQPELFRMPLEPKILHKKDRLTQFDTELLTEKLNSLMVNEKVFL